MENSTPVTAQVMINNLVIDKKMQEYRDSKELQYFWDILSDCVSEERISIELSENAGKYYGNKTLARNKLIRQDLETAKLFATARDSYAKITCEKILQFFRISIFSWSTGGKNYANGGDIESFKRMPIAHLAELYNHDNVLEMEALSELVDEIIVKIMDEFKNFEAVRSCFIFYNHRPAFGKNPPIYRDCLEYVNSIARHARFADKNESYFQNAGAQIRQYREMLDPEKSVPEDYKLFLTSSDKSTSQIRHDIEETLTQYIRTLVSFEQMQKRGTKNEIKQDLEIFLSETGYTLETLRIEIAPTYKTTMDKIIFKRSGWELHEIPEKK
jgi:hypothetical protein